MRGHLARERGGGERIYLYFLKLFCVEVLDYISGLYIGVDIFLVFQTQAKIMGRNCQSHYVHVKGV